MGTKPAFINPDKVEEVNRHITAITPQLVKLSMLLKECNVHEFEVMIGNGYDKVSWTDGAIPQLKSPTQDQLTIELTNMLDQQYPPISGFTFMNMIWNPNRAIAEKMAAMVAEYRKRDRAQVEAQIVAILAAFKQGV